MIKNKTIMRLLSKILFAGLLTSILPTSLPLNSQPRPGETIQQTMQRERLKKEVEQKIDRIRNINWRLKAVQVAIPTIILAISVLPATPIVQIIFWTTSAAATIAKKIFKVSTNTNPRKRI